MLSIASNDAGLTAVLLVLSAGACGSSSLGGAGRRWRCRRLRRVSGGPGARSIVHDERGLRRRLAHHELLRSGAGVRSARVRAGALLDAGSAVRPTYPACGCAAQQPFADDGSRLQFHGRRASLASRAVHHVRSRLRRALRDGHDLFQLHRPRQHVRGMHDGVHRQHRLSRCRTSAVPKRFDRQHVRDVLHRIERRMRHADDSNFGAGNDDRG